MSWAEWRRLNPGVARRSARNDLIREQWKAAVMEDRGTVSTASSELGW